MFQEVVKDAIVNPLLRLGGLPHVAGDGIFPQARQEPSMDNSLSQETTSLRFGDCIEWPKLPKGRSEMLLLDPCNTSFLVEVDDVVPDNLEISSNVSIGIFVLKQVIELETPRQRVIKSFNRTIPEQIYQSFHGVNELFEELGHIVEVCPLHEFLVRAGEFFLEANGQVKSSWISNDGELPNSEKAHPVYPWLVDARQDEVINLFLQLWIILKLLIIEKDP